MVDIYGKNFQEARLRVLERDGNRCRTCDHDGSIWRLECHHRHYRDGGNPKDEDLITLCVRCHNLITTAMRSDRYTKINHEVEEVKPTQTFKMRAQDVSKDSIEI